MVLIQLLLAHLLGDFLLQPTAWVEAKNKKKLFSWHLYAHVVIHGLLVFFFLGMGGAWKPALVLMVLHFGIDALKIYQQTPADKHRWFIYDQLLHILSIIVVVQMFYPIDMTVLSPTDYKKMLAHGTAIYFLTQPIGIIIAHFLKPWSDDISEDANASLANAGTYIGILERIFVYTFIVFGHWEAVGFLVAAKSVFRFGDLHESKNRKLTEYILIGTLISFGLAMLTGLCVKYLV